MASNANPLHPPLEAEQYSGYTSIGCALVVPPGTFLIPHRRWLPQPAYTPPSKWKVSTGSGSKQFPSISFDYVDRPNQGVPMRELSARNVSTLVQVLQGPNEPVFSQTGLRKITLRIHWPGYPHVDWARTIELVSSGGPITRVQLATAIAMNYGRFMELARTAKPTSPDFVINVSAIQFEHLVLVALRHVFEDVWQADVALDRR
ncbi:hypothetical protein MD484_g8221, partial [Candolleomyces efflorescens]